MKLIKNLFKTENSYKKFIFYCFTGFAFALTVILICLPKNFFDSGQSICISVLLLKKECYGCGMTRAIQHLIHLDFKSAYHYNRLSFIVLPLSIYMGISEIYKLYKQTKN